MRITRLDWRTSTWSLASADDSKRRIRYAPKSDGRWNFGRFAERKTARLPVGSLNAARSQRGHCVWMEASTMMRSPADTQGKKRGMAVLEASASDTFIVGWR